MDALQISLLDFFCQEPTKYFDYKTIPLHLKNRYPNGMAMHTELFDMEKAGLIEQHIARNKSYKISSLGIRTIDTIKNKNENKQEKENLDLQKLRSENQKLVNELSDYSKVKRQRNNAYKFSIISILISAATVILAYLKYISNK